MKQISIVSKNNSPSTQTIISRSLGTLLHERNKTPEAIALSALFKTVSVLGEVHRKL